MSLRSYIAGLNLGFADSQRELEVRKIHHVQVLSLRIPGHDQRGDHPPSGRAHIQ
jgi:hypothetical protein